MTIATKTMRVTIKHHWREKGTRSGVIEVTVDLDAVALQLAHRALWSKSKKSKMAAGAIVGRVHSVEEVKP